MNLPLFIAKKYFFSKKKKNFINIISIIAMVALAAGSGALIVILSVFNGLEDLIRSLHNHFDPQLKVEATVGKSFEISDDLISKIQEVEGVAIVTEVVEDNAYVKYRNSTMVVNIKGVEDNFIDHRRLDDKIVQGTFKLKENDMDFTVLGRGVQYTLGIVNLKDLYAVHVYYPDRKAKSAFNPTNLVNHKTIIPAGIFAIEKQYDLNYMFVPLDFAMDLLDYDSRRSYLEIKVADNASIANVQKRLIATLGEQFRVLNSDQQHSGLIKAVKIEKLIVFLILSLVVFILSFNIFFSLTMLAIDKRRDFSVLYALGANNRHIRRIFFSESIMIACIGALSGLIIGIAICLIQSKYGLVKLGMASAVMENYPVKVEPLDILYILMVVVIITLLASFKPSNMIKKLKISDYL